MASTSSIIQMMNSIMLEDEEKEGKIIENVEGEENTEAFKSFDVKLCLVGRFLTEGVVGFPSTQQRI